MEQWVTLGTSIGPLVNALGIGALAVLFATDRILTIGQHKRRVTDILEAQKLTLIELKEHYDELAGEKDRAYGELKESRNYYRDARLEEKARADKVTNQLANGFEEFGKLSTHLLGSITELAKDAPHE